VQTKFRFSLPSRAASHRRAVFLAGALPLCLDTIKLYKDEATVCHWTLGVLNNICRDPGKVVLTKHSGNVQGPPGPSHSPLALDHSLEAKKAAGEASAYTVISDLMSHHASSSDVFQGATELLSRLPKPRAIREDHRGR
jgi:hypothetical protein